MKQSILSIRYLLLYAIIAGFLMSLTPFSLALLPNKHGHSNQDLHLLDAFVLLFLNVVILYFSLWLNLVIVELPKWRKIAYNLLLYVGLTLAAILIHSPVWALLERMPIIFFIRDEIGRNIIIFSISALVANALYSLQQNQLMKNKIIEIQRQTLTGQLESLKQQINPHFFFNALNTLSGLAQENSPRTVEFIAKLSQVFRYLLQIQEKNLVAVAEEIDFANAYLYLLKVRFDNKFTIQIHTDLISDCFVPSLCTQLLLENCFKHNSMSQREPLQITIGAEDGFLVIQNQVDKLLTVEGNGIGLKNLNERSLLLSGKPIEITNTNKIFSVKIPAIKL